MLAAALLASLWAQAEQAPPPTPPPAPQAEQAPPGQAEQAPPPTPPPGQAEQAPSPVAPLPTPTLARPEPTVRKNDVSVQARIAYRVGNDGRSLGPSGGFSLGGSFERRYRARENGFELGIGADFFYDRFATAVVGSAPDATGQPTLFAGDRILSQTSFAALQTAGWRGPDVRLFAAVGPGVTIGYFSSPESDLRPGNKTTVQPFARAVLGTEVALSPFTAVLVRADYTHVLTQPTFTTETAAIYSLFGDIIDVGVGLLVRF